ncbi:virulence factor family protein [Methylobrevis sp. L22]|uniref:Virulence factor family protein n=2 Tax=Methylobrevis albus TaxID=2793297 RepID=A0A931I023_9HYPH|nr:virulence factor family protein [Methylobrevis albus]
MLPHGIFAPHPAAVARADTTIEAEGVAAALEAPDGTVRGLAILVSDAGGLTPADAVLAADLTGRGLAVAAVDLSAWRRQLDTGDGDCVYLGSALEGLAKAAARTLALDNYFHPVVIGRGEGGLAAYAAVADAPAATLAGAVVIDPARQLHTARPVCAGAPATRSPTGGYAYGPADRLPEPVRLLLPADTAQPLGGALAGRAGVTAATVAGDAARLAAAADAAAALARGDAAAAALPAIDLPATGTPTALAVFFSGDGGWRDLDKTIGEALAARGVHVVGVDSLRYFWSARSPEEMADDITALVARADPTGRLPVALLGYSFGANTLPFAYAALPPALGERAKLVALLAPEATTRFQVSVAGWLGLGGDHAVGPAIAALPAAHTVCIYGAEEQGTACTLPELRQTPKLELGGGHHFDGNYAAIADRILGWIDGTQPLPSI